MTRMTSRALVLVLLDGLRLQSSAAVRDLPGRRFTVRPGLA